jgi:hypothetical protein
MARPLPSETSTLSSTRGKTSETSGFSASAAMRSSVNRSPASVTSGTLAATLVGSVRSRRSPW